MSGRTRGVTVDEEDEPDRAPATMPGGVEQAAAERLHLSPAALAALRSVAAGLPAPDDPTLRDTGLLTPDGDIAAGLEHLAVTLAYPRATGAIWRLTSGQAHRTHLWWSPAALVCVPVVTGDRDEHPFWDGAPPPHLDASGRRARRPTGGGPATLDARADGVAHLAAGAAGPAHPR